MRSKRLIIALLICTLSSKLFGQHATQLSTQPGTQPTTQPTTAPVQVNLLAMGDWGSNGANQRAVATGLMNYVLNSTRHFDGMLLAGDNFYTKLKGTDDPLWQEMFEKLYDNTIMNFPFYVSLGNHDYDGGKEIIERAYAMQHPESRWKMPASYYRVDLPADHPLVTIFMLDSNHDKLTPQYWQKEIDWLNFEMQQPRAAWTICCAHHPLFSNGDHGDNGVLQADWGPIFKAGHVDLYLCGHDHDLQHLEMPGWPMSFMLVGGGGQWLKPERVDKRGPFSKSTFGFASMQFTPQYLDAWLIAKDDTVLHHFRRSKEGKIETIQNSPSDTATPRTPGSITRNGEIPATNPAAE